MTATNLIDIHEFSTGIEVKRTPTGWESGGFTAEYMNQTIDLIPKGVLDSIANREFALAEGAASQEPVLVGREVTGYGETWSVVAVVTRGRDDRGRGLPLYRYFLCRGEGGVEIILRWMGQEVRVFDPFDTQKIEEPHRWSASSMAVPLKEKLQAMLGQSPPIVIPASQACTPLLLNQMVKEVGMPGGRAWAYKVAALERPEYFQAIYPADSKAETVLKQVLARRQSQSVVPIAGEAAIKTAIKAVMNGRPKSEHVANLENALKNHQQINDKYWDSILDKEGASQALNGNIYDNRFVRLLTLKAMLIPQFLPDFLGWLANSKASEEHYSASLNLQEAMLKAEPQFINNFPELSKRLKGGICIVISRLVRGVQILAESQLLLTPSPGLWSNVYQKSLHWEFENDLELMPKYAYKQRGLAFQATKYPEWENLLESFKECWRPPNKPYPEYLTLAILFEEAGTLRLAAIFYQIAEGSVPKSLFSYVSSEPKSFGMKINQRKGFIDYVYWCLWKKVDIGGFPVPRSVALLIFAIVFVMGGCSGWLIRDIGLGQNQLSNSRKEERQEASYDRDLRYDYDLNPSYPSDSKALESSESNLSPENSQKYDRTNRAINAIVTNYHETVQNLIKQGTVPPKVHNYLYDDNVNNKEKSRNIVLFCVKEILGLPKIQYSAIDDNDANWERFSNKIKEYQRKKDLAVDGAIDEGKNTQIQLEGDLQKCLKLSDPEPYPSTIRS